MSSTFGAAFDKLDRETQLKIIANLRVRMRRYVMAMSRGYVEATKVVIVGDTPGPGRPTATGYHHTPFYSTKNSSLFVNQKLVEAGIPEESLLWYNSTLADGTKLPAHHILDLERYSPKFILLGGNAEKWFTAVAPGLHYVKVFHPAYAKRFHAHEPYALIDEVRKALDEKSDN